jgi:hypothetical protein
MKKVFYFLPIVVCLMALTKTPNANDEQDRLVIEETFFTLDTVWTPGVRNKYPLFPFDNYLLLKDGIATLIIEDVRGLSFRGPMNDIQIQDTKGKRTTRFTVRNAKMRVELMEQENNRYEIYVYKYLGSYERMFVATWIDLSKTKILFDED